MSKPGGALPSIRSTTMLTSNMIASFLEFLAAEKGASPLTIRTYATDLGGWKDFVAPGVDDDAFDPMAVTTNDTRAWIADMGRR